jgi:branched-subunit amino acid transport protein AzlD
MQHLSQTVSPALPHPCLRALLATIALHKWKHQTLLSVAGGTFCYVLLVQLVF